MRKTQKKQAENFVILLDQSHGEIKKSIDTGNYILAMELLVQCQEDAIKLGGLIEKTEGEKFVTIPLLEEYCELTYQIHEKIRQNQLENSNKVYKNLNKLLRKIEKSVKNDIKMHLEVVFLPYKASMWDSMESVWKAADGDENCDAYVIPIPYYDKNPDKSFGEMHYEGGQYPDYIPVIGYEDYNFAERRPDIVFIHNPYDNYNFVTSVHPFFYSKNLKQYTEKLVYIPYFLTGGVMDKSFFEFPSYYYVDYIVTQSEGMKEFYTDKVWDKLLPLGTPKFDKILNYSIYDRDIPESWKRKIVGKVIFYNLSISSVLQYEEVIFKKIIYMLNEFQDSGCTLIFRPHPLLKATLKSMRPQFVNLYENIENMILGMDNVILDDTPSANLAIKLSHAYIGEETSSMVHMFGMEGKPVFLLNETILENYDDENDNIRIFDLVKVTDGYWTVAGDRNCLIHFSNTGEILETYEIPNEKKDDERLYNSIILKDTYLYLIPYRAKEIAVFDLDDKKFTKIEIKNPKRTNFSHGYVYKDSIYMVPTEYDAILQLDCSDNKVVYHKKIVDEMKLLKDNKTEYYTFNGNLLDGNKLYIAAAFGNYVFILNLDTYEYEKKVVGNETTDFWCMSGGDGIYLLGTNHGCKLLLWDEKENTVNELQVYPSKWQGNDKCFYEMVDYGNDIYVFPKTANMILKVEKTTGNICKYKGELSYEEGQRKSSYYTWSSNYLMAKKIGELMVIQSAYDYGIRIVDMENVKKYVNVKLQKQYMPYRWDTLFTRRNRNLPWAMREHLIYSLKNFIKYVQNEEHNVQEQKKAYLQCANNIDGTCGEKIYYTIKERES